MGEGDPKVLVVDDEPILAEGIARALRSAGLGVETAPDAHAALAKLDGAPFGLVLMDLQLPGMSGLEALAAIREKHPATEVIVMTGHGTVETAVEAMKKGAFEFLEKPFPSLEHLVLVARRALERASLRAENESLKLAAERRHPGLVGASAAIRKIGELVSDLSRSTAPVLVIGESGTGKEIVARAIHAAGTRSSRPFVAVNCAALPEAVLESELFGHERGAFTGAVSASRGLFRAAEGGTIFLDEIAEMPPTLQAKLLRVLQDGEVRPVGSTTAMRVDARVIAATNRDLKSDIPAGRFREDLYYRLAVVQVQIPPLRERRDDIPILVRHFVRKLNAEHPKFDDVEPQALDRLAAWHWPGNVRELENVIERAFALGKPGRLGLEHLPPEISGAAPRVAAEELSAIPLSLDAFERFAFERALKESDGDAGKAASLLGMPRSTFYRRLQRLGVKAKVR